MNRSRRHGIHRIPVNGQPGAADEYLPPNAAAHSDFQGVRIMQGGNVVILEILLANPVGTFPGEMEIFQEGHGGVFSVADSLFHTQSLAINRNIAIILNNILSCIFRDNAR